MNDVKIYTTSTCPFCNAAKDLLKSRNISYEEIDVSDEGDFDALVKKTGWKTVPQIFFGEKLIGGYRELTALDREGKLKKN
jgi:glutaredoxin 3